MRIGQLARIVGISTRAIRHYHRIGLIPEPVRESNGYRTYTLDDVLRLLRIRRLAAAGMSLDEIGDVLADGDQGRDLREILDELDAQLHRQEEAIGERRRLIAELAEAAGAGLPPQQSPHIAEHLAQLYGDAGATAHIEQSMMELLTDKLPAATPMYEALLADPSLTEWGTTVAERFDGLHAASPDDPEVQAVATSVLDVVTSFSDSEIAATLAEVTDTSTFTADDLAAAVGSSAELSAAQARCLQLIVDGGREI